MKKRPLLTIASAVLVVAGVVLGGYATVQIKEMNANSGSQVLPELAPSSLLTGAHSTAQDVYNSANIKRGDFIGKIMIPALNQTLPIYEGTEDSQLKMGIGHYEKSVLPGVADNSVLAGHRDSVFSKLGKLKIGELLIVDTQAGKFTYKISGFRIVKADDRTVIVPTKTAVLTLSTCYPFRFIGNAPKRYIVSANLIPESPAL
jgi:sortase A